MTKKVLYEYIKLVLQKTKQSLFRESLGDPPENWNYFHVSSMNLGNTFAFVPRIPTWTGYCDAEDFTTPRVCLSTSLKNAVYGRFGSLEIKHFAQPEMFVYAIKHVSKLVIPKNGIELSEPNNNGELIGTIKNAKDHGLDPNDKNLHAETCSRTRER